MSRKEARHVSPDQVVTITCGAMILAAVHRVTFSVLAVPFAAEFHMSLPEMGLLQSAALIGYLLGQIPAGVVADRLGGVHVLLAGLACWSTMTGLNPLAAYTTHPLKTLIVMRAALGLAQSVMMPSVSATAARWVPPANRGKAIATIYAASSGGTVLGLMTTPLLAQLLGGWPACFLLFAGLGIIWAVGCWMYLPAPASAPYASASLKQTLPEVQVAAGLHQPNSRRKLTASSQTQLLEADLPADGGSAKLPISRSHHIVHILALCWVHSVIGWGFFILQSWIPTYLNHLGMTDLKTVGFLSALPWLGTAIAALVAGKVAGHLRDHKGWNSLRVRTFCQDVATLGPAVSLLPLIISSQGSSVATAVLCLTGTLSSQAFCYAGFHAYVQDVAPQDAGKLLGITNTCGTMVGILGNIVTGNIAASQGGYPLVFALISGGYLSSFVVWRIWVNGHNIVLGNQQLVK
ncbi:hypothetical protein WJX77_002503 [Trebouxia sp. C0004]